MLKHHSPATRSPLRTLRSPLLAPRSSRRAFTLVELLVVIVIIGILASLVTVAAIAALKAARRAAIIAEISQISTGVEEYKNKATSYPPNAIVDGAGGSNPVDEAQVLNDFKRHMKQAFPRHRESDALLLQLVGQGSDPLEGGMSAGEALVFWLGGFSADPKYPISGEGGPSYLASMGIEDPIESRSWIYPVAIDRLLPRDSNGYFDSTAGNRYIEFPDPKAPTDNSKRRRINFWQYIPAGSEQPYLYFDVSRNDPTATSDPPAASSLSPNPLHVHAIKQVSSTPSAVSTGVPIEFANNGKFQILHCGLDEEWGEDAFEEMSVHAVNSTDPTDYLLYPDGPFVGEVADTLTNFTEGTLEDSQP